MIDGFAIDLEFYERSDVELSRLMRDAAARCPRCSACGHHPNAHVRGGCNVTVERPSNRNAKCGCGAVKLAA